MGKDGILYPNLLAPTEDESRYGKYGSLRIRLMAWVEAMENIRSAAEEIVVHGPILA